MQSRKSYTAPELVVYGDVRKITQSAHEKNSDSPKGTADTAFPVSP
jgi:hypothetical protein